MSQKFASSLLIAVLTAAIAAGCGGGGGDDGESAATLPAPTVTTSSITKAAFTKRANQICGEGAADVEKLLAKALESKGGEKAVQVGAEAALLGMVKGVIGEISELGAPAGEEARVEALLDSMQQAYNEASESTNPSIVRLARVFEESGTVARADGLNSCAFS